MHSKYHKINDINKILFDLVKQVHLTRSKFDLVRFDLVNFDLVNFDLINFDLVNFDLIIFDLVR